MINPMKLARMQKGMTQYDLARAVGCYEGLISKIETGRIVPDLTLKEKIAKVLDISTFEVG